GSTNGVPSVFISIQNRSTAARSPLSTCFWRAEIRGLGTPSRQGTSVSESNTRPAAVESPNPRATVRSEAFIQLLQVSDRTTDRNQAVGRPLSRRGMANVLG